jgi:hypothetical protein
MLVPSIRKIDGSSSAVVSGSSRAARRLFLFTIGKQMSDLAVLTEDDYFTAIHESGHVICARVLGITPSRVIIRPAGPRGSRTFLTNCKDAQSIIIMTYAGGIASRNEGGDARDGSDREDIARLARENGFTPRQLDVFERMARRICARHAPEIRKLALQLHVRGVYRLAGDRAIYLSDIR